jgi:hypothetical protein
MSAPTTPTIFCKYRLVLVYDYHHPLTHTLAAAPIGETDLMGTTALPALDFLRSDVLAGDGSLALVGSAHVEPAASLLRMFDRAKGKQAAVYVFGRFYAEGHGLHDTHMNQGSTKSFIHRAGDDSIDHNDVWQDGAVIVNFGDAAWAVFCHLPTAIRSDRRPGQSDAGQ